MNRKHNRNRKNKERDTALAVVIICAILIPGALGVLIPAVGVYHALKHLAGVDLIDELKKVLGHEEEKGTGFDQADYTQNYIPQQRSSVQKTDGDPCGNESYHSAFSGHEVPTPRSSVRKTDGDPCGNEGYHGTFSEKGHIPSQAAPKGTNNGRPENRSTQTSGTVQGSFFERVDDAKRMAQEKIDKLIRRANRLSRIGLVIGGIFGLTAVIEEIESIIERWQWLGEDFLTLLVFALVGVGLFAVGKAKASKAKQYRKILTVIGENTSHISLHALADAMAMSDDKVEKMVQEMIDEGLFSDAAYVDITTGYLILDGKGVDKAPEPEAAPADDSLNLSVLKEIRRVNENIPDPVMTRKISRIEEITKHILDYQKKHPEKTTELRKFLDYYLPTTLKILNTYAELDQKGLSGDNATATKERIEKIMDNLVEGFEAQLDKLFEGEMMDISSDITVMEKMLDSDGLTGGFKIPKMDTESVADDAFQTVELTMEKLEPTRPIAEPRPASTPAPTPQPAVAQSSPAAASFPAGAYSGISLTLEPEKEAETPSSSADDMFQSIHQSLGGTAAQPSSADDMFQNIHLSLGDEQKASDDWQSGFYHHTKDELD